MENLQQDVPLFLLASALTSKLLVKNSNKKSEKKKGCLRKFLPSFLNLKFIKNGSYIGCLSKEFSFLTPHYNIDYNGWHIDGTIMEWDYSILDRSGYSIARVSKELFHMTDTYVMMCRIQEMRWML